MYTSIKLPKKIHVCIFGSIINAFLTIVFKLAMGLTL